MNEQPYLCRDCLSTFNGWPNMHPGDQYCKPCTEAQAASMAASMERQINLEAMGFSPAEVEADLRAWYAASRAWE